MVMTFFVHRLYHNYNVYIAMYLSIVLYSIAFFYYKQTQIHAHLVMIILIGLTLHCMNDIDCAFMKEFKRS